MLRLGEGVAAFDSPAKPAAPDAGKSSSPSYAWEAKMQSSPSPSARSANGAAHYRSEDEATLGLQFGSPDDPSGRRGSAAAPAAPAASASGSEGAVASAMMAKMDEMQDQLAAQMLSFRQREDSMRREFELRESAMKSDFESSLLEVKLAASSPGGVGSLAAPFAAEPSQWRAAPGSSMHVNRHGECFYKISRSISCDEPFSQFDSPPKHIIFLKCREHRY